VLALCSLACAEARAIEPVPESEFLERLVEAWCTGTGPCCVAQGFDGTLPDCERVVRQAWQKRIELARAAHAVYDPLAAGQCLALRRTLVKACRSLKVDDPGRMNGCARVYRGRSDQRSESCTLDWECSDSALGEGRCNTKVEEHGTTTACEAVQQSVAEGEAIHMLDDEATRAICEPGLYEGVDGRCHAPVGYRKNCDNQAGFASDVCTLGNTCDLFNTGKCVTALPLGDECGDPTQCEGWACENGHCVVPANIGPCRGAPTTRVGWP
jgi:hypothetical protein